MEDDGEGLAGEDDVRSTTGMSTSRPVGRLGFDEFFAAEQADLLRFCWGLTLRADDARDVAQEAMTRAFQDWGRLADGNPVGWLRTVALNIVRNRWRSDQRGGVALARLAALPTGAVGPAEAPTSGEVTAALLSLPERQREAVVLHHMADLPVAEVAGMMGIGVPAVKTHLQRGRAALVHLLGCEFEGDDHV